MAAATFFDNELFYTSLLRYFCNKNPVCFGKRLFSKYNNNKLKNLMITTV